MTPLGTVSDYSPVLNQYTTQITAVVIGILFHISSTIFWKQRRTQIQHKVSMIILGIVLAYFYNFGRARKKTGRAIPLLFFLKKTRKT
jgi:hypothetical protein